MKLFFTDVKAVEGMEEGPLGPYLVSYAEQLRAEGYARQSACLQLRLVSDFSRWLGQKGVPVNEVVAQHTVDYLRHRKRRGYRPRRGAPAALARLLKLLREHGVIAQQSRGLAMTQGECLLREFDLYLEKERALALATRINYLPFVRQFLASQFGKRPVELSSL